MKVPCYDCILKIMCMQKVEKQWIRYNELQYPIHYLIVDCEELQKYFEISNIERIKYKHNYNRFIDVICKSEYGKKLLEDFLKVMHKRELPTSIHPQIRVSKTKKRIR